MKISFPVKKAVCLFTICLFICKYSLLNAQGRTNFGLTRPQPVASLPSGLTPPDVPTLKTKVPANASLRKNKQGNYELNNGWELADGQTVTANNQSIFSADYDSRIWYNATVPGTVLTTLVQQGVYPDPYIGLNNMAIPEDLSRKDWWYRIAFSAPAEEAGKLAWLQLNGINYKADIWLNGQMIGSMIGAFVRGNFNVTDIIKKDRKNILAIHIYPPNNPGIPHEQSKLAGMGPNGGQLALDGPTFIASEGWDWVPGIRDRNIGIWQDVQLTYTGAVTLHDPQVITSLPLPDTTHANLTIKAAVKNNSTTVQTAEVKGTIEQINFTTTVTLQPGEVKIIVFNPQSHRQLQLVNPRLWWPNGYGNPELYHLQLQVNNAGKISDNAKVRFGIREFSYELMADAPQQKKWRFEYFPTKLEKQEPVFDNVKRRDAGNRIFIPTLREDVNTKTFISFPDTTNPYLVIKVNGVKVFCKGGNWGMDDGMKRVERERLEPAFKLHLEANYNMVRNWTGESTQASFFELADEYGMLVYNDFWISTEGYNLNPNDQLLWLKNSLDVIRRYRNHPSIAIWCPRNEGYAPVGIEEELAKQLAEEDGTRHYIGNSREINQRQSGDWHYVENYKEYFTRYADGFSTEIGTFSVPVASTIRKFIKPEDQWPINDVWHYHDLHSNNQNLPGYLKAVDSMYGTATGLDDFSKKVQLINYETHRAIFEAWNSKQWENGSGVLLWMTHPAWPSMIWQTYSWDYETHGSYFGAKKACEPVHIQMNLHDNKVILSNQSQVRYANASAFIEVYDIKGKRLFNQLYPVNAAANIKTDITTPDFSSANLPGVYMIRLQLKDKYGKVISENNYWKTNSDFTAFNQLANVKLSGKAINTNATSAVFTVVNKSNAPAIGIKLNLVDEKNNILLPAYFSDGYFTLLPGEVKQLTVQFPTGTKASRVKTDGYNNITSYINLK